MTRKLLLSEQLKCKYGFLALECLTQINTDQTQGFPTLLPWISHTKGLNLNVFFYVHEYVHMQMYFSF